MKQIESKVNPDHPESPLPRYQRLVDAGSLSADPAQAQVVGLLNDLHQRLLEPTAVPSLWDRLRLRWQPTVSAPLEGLYIWGGVGRGKTMLMDMFCECLPEDLWLRMHFHRFMQRVHNDLKRLAGTANPLEKVADGLAAEGRVLCFDEFFVSDIGDAMILGELLAALFARGVTLIATSNVEPSLLYENGLQRRRFLPAIKLLQQHTQIVELASPTDYRLRVLERAEIYHHPLDTAAEQSLEQSFSALAVEARDCATTLLVEGREIQAKRVADDVAWFEFAELCEGPRSQNDYIELARVYHAVLLSSVPMFTSAREDAARRFISLVDEFYDRSVKLIVSAEVPVLELYQGERLRFEFERTQSRLLEMQSLEYLGRTHRA